MLYYPNINPIAYQIGSLSIHWYGVMYIIGFVSAWTLARRRARQDTTWTKAQISDLIFYAGLGVIIGGRLGYVLFYDTHYFLYHPLQILQIWQGGMSFHGGLLGVLIALWWFSQREYKTYFQVMDFVAPLVPIGLGAGRLGNFINGELWGRVTTVPWGMIYPYVDQHPRHPSELYEFFCEGILLFTILWIYSSKPRPTRAVSALFLILYGSFRFILEFFRQPDPQLGFIAWDWLTMGQLLSVPMVIAGIILFYLAYRHRSDQQQEI